MLTNINSARFKLLVTAAVKELRAPYVVSGEPFKSDSHGWVVQLRAPDGKYKELKVEILPAMTEDDIVNAIKMGISNNLKDVK